MAERPMHGYELLERFRVRGMGLWAELSRASTYQVLKRLERRGLVAGKTQEGLEGPDRRVFRITRSGRDHLIEGIAELARAATPGGADAGVALAFAHVLPAATAKATTDVRERTVRALLDAVRGELDRTASSHDLGRAVSTAMLHRQEALAEAELAWLKSYRAALGKVRR
ncbi:MAG TPA: PadR family transcriptional regulator [Actinomycetota bacterium]|nr:PadR family transcriptional regulator [Actinomycetota bacterium]